MESSILCLGNPLLDVSSNVDAAFLKKYDVSVCGPGCGAMVAIA